MGCAASLVEQLEEYDKKEREKRERAGREPQRSAAGGVSRRAAATTSAPAESFVVGQRVERKDDGDQFWGKGYVTSTDPLLVTMSDTDDEGRVWDHVRSTEAGDAAKMHTARKIPTVRRLMDHPGETAAVMTTSAIIGAPGVGTVYWNAREGRDLTHGLGKAAMLGEAGEVLGDWVEDGALDGAELGDAKDYIDTDTALSAVTAARVNARVDGGGGSLRSGGVYPFTTHAEGKYKLFGDGAVATRTTGSMVNYKCHTVATDPLPHGGKHYAEFTLLSGSQARDFVQDKESGDFKWKQNEGFYFTAGGEPYFIGVIAAGADIETNDAQKQRGNCFLDTMSGRRLNKDTGGVEIGEKWAGTPGIGQGEFAVNGDCVGLLLDNNVGSLTVYKNDQWVGVMVHSGLTSQYRWAASLLKKGHSVSIEAKPPPE